MEFQFQRVGIHDPHSREYKSKPAGTPAAKIQDPQRRGYNSKQAERHSSCSEVKSSSTSARPRKLTENVSGILKPQNLLPVTHFFQKGYTSECFSNNSTNWGTSFCLITYVWDALPLKPPSHLTSRNFRGERLGTRNNILTNSLIT